eukprot:6301189-Pyramimonas_sp.AAC.1
MTERTIRTDKPLMHADRVGGFSADSVGRENYCKVSWALHASGNERASAAAWLKAAGRPYLTMVSSSSTPHRPRRYLVDYRRGGTPGCSGFARRNVYNYAA